MTEGFSMDSMVKVAACLGAALVMGIGSIAPSLSQGTVAAQACESIGKYPQAAEKIRSLCMISLFIIETSPVYCLLISLILLLFT